MMMICSKTNKSLRMYYDKMYSYVILECGINRKVWLVLIYARLADKHGYLCGLVVGVPGCRPRGLGLDSRCYQIFCIAVGLEQGPLSLMRINEEPLERKNSGSSLEN
jgi:hypothetical protein